VRAGIFFMLNRFAVGLLTFLTCLWFLLLFDVAGIVEHLGKILNILDSD
jgi:hypothetical protein